MTDECIHGLEAGLCDICYPKKRSEPARAAPRPRTTRPPAGPRLSTNAASGPRSGPRAPVAKPVDIGWQRLFHLTHVDNLESILVDGRLIAGAIPAVDISAAGVRDTRREAVVGDRTVADFVPFFLVPDAALWTDFRAGNPDPLLATTARRHEPAEFVLLVTTIADAGDVVIADGFAGAAATRFARDPDEAQRMLRRLTADETALAASEALVADEVPFERISLIGVAHDRARDAVRRVLEQSIYSPRVAVHPPWFARPE